MSAAGAAGPVRGGPLAMVQLSGSQGGEDDAPLLMRAWIIPPRMAEAFAAAMTERFGQAIEAVSTVGGAVALAEQPGGPSYLHPGDPDA